MKAWAIERNGKLVGGTLSPAIRGAWKLLESLEKSVGCAHHAVCRRIIAHRLGYRAVRVTVAATTKAGER